jgi:thiol-disulfide isomerase/thioredoxin
MYYGLGVRFALLVLVACAAPAAPPPAKSPAPAPAPAPPATPSWIGVFFEPGTARIAQVIPTSPAEKAGLLEGDEIIAFDHQLVHDGKQVTARVQAASGDHDLGIKRGMAPHTIRVHLEPRPPIDNLASTLQDKPAPAFSMPTYDGRTFSLADGRGKIVVLDFWATWCGPCLEQMPILVDLAKRYPDVMVVGVNSDDDAALNEVLDGHSPYTIARDEQQASWRKYFVTALPTTFVIDAQGIVRHIELGLGDPTAIEQVVVSLRSQPSP